MGRCGAVPPGTSLVLLALMACVPEAVQVPEETRDAAATQPARCEAGLCGDVDALDSGQLDSSAIDLGTPDRARADHRGPDGQQLDAARTDQHSPDSTVSDSAIPDSAEPDAASPDSGPPTYPCPPLGGTCAAVEASAVEHHIEAVDGCAFSLTPPVQTHDALINALVARAGGALGIADILGDLNRDGVAGVTQQTADRLVNHAWQGFRWNSGDMAVSYWYPQGISSSSDAADSGRIADRRLLMVSWYHKTDTRPTKGVRISLADITDLDNVSYRHMLLVEPLQGASGVDIGPAQNDYGDFNALHAGGIVWYGDLLYVADTAYGLRVFDLSRIIQVSHTDDTGRIGITSTRIDAHGYRYAIPQLARYELTAESCPLRFSFAGLDRSADPHRIVTGEYASDHPSGRIVAWQIDAATGWLDARAGEVRGVDAYVSGQTRMQGALTLDGNVYISSSSQTASSFGRLYRTRPGMESSISAWPYGCEDLSYERDTTLIWTAAEHPGTRDVVGIPLRLP